MDKTDRYKTLIRYLIRKGIAQSQKEIGVMVGYNNPSAFSQVINGKANEPKHFMEKLLGLCPEEVNQNWLITGEGSMFEAHRLVLSATGGSIVQHISDSPDSGKKTIYNGVAAHQHNAEQQTAEMVELETRPLVPPEITRKPNLDVYEYAKTAEIKQSYPALPFFPNVDLYCRVLDDSMQPRFFPGDILALSNFNQENGTLREGKAFIIDTYSIGFIFSLVYDKGEYYECVPSNKESEIKTTKVSKRDIIRIYRVVGMMRLIG